MTACDLCKGACCERIVIFKEGPNDPNWEVMSMRGENHGGYIVVECPCNMLSSGRCSIYETRPKQCRDFLVGSEMCKMAAKHRKNWKEIFALMP